ncbi:hypothetical protein [Subtercola lobariae]|uniref:Uncharacterized protein n=1 Tax=Subtercola lobariae TaxID=1588641 RepID=A0A917EUE6_9MICO|nr:hypothetical protein [Subtercola lobariae]GGF15004.1 hypothetical protein GCM10011399_06140 [Subtercola lobariae]
MSDRLFSRGDLRATLENHERIELAKVNSLEPQKVREHPEVAVAEVVESARVEPLTFNWEGITRGPVSEAVVERRDFGELIQIPGQKVTIHVPFSGDEILLDCRASTFSLSGFPFDVDVTRTHVNLHISETTLTAQSISTELSRFKSAISEKAGWANTDVSKWAVEFESKARNAVLRRQEELEKIASLENDIGIPLA